MRGGYSFHWQCSRVSTRHAVGVYFFFCKPEKLHLKSHKRKWQSAQCCSCLSRGGYSHSPISLSVARQTDHRPDKHNHSRHRFREHLSAGKKLKKAQYTHLVIFFCAEYTTLSSTQFNDDCHQELWQKALRRLRSQYSFAKKLKENHWCHIAWMNIYIFCFTWKINTSFMSHKFWPLIENHSSYILKHI